MKTISHDEFAMVCFLVLMQNGEGLMDKSPDYVSEKKHVMTTGYDAFSYLDFYNMRKVIEWLEQWKIETPLPIKKEWDLQNEAMNELASKGIIL